MKSLGRRQGAQQLTARYIASVEARTRLPWTCPASRAAAAGPLARRNPGKLIVRKKVGSLGWRPWNRPAPEAIAAGGAMCIEWSGAEALDLSAELHKALIGTLGNRWNASRSP